MFDKDKNQIYLDLDGVFADFNGSFLRQFGIEIHLFEEKYGRRETWKKIRSDKNFFRNHRFLEGSMKIYDTVKPLKPIILTGSPPDQSYHFQKLDWCAEYFGVSQPVVICPSSKKSDYCNPGDLIIDDMDKHMQKWLDKGGLWILHKSVNGTLEKLEALGISA